MSECHRTEPRPDQNGTHSQHGQAGVNCLGATRRRKATKTPSYTRNSLFPLSSRRRTARVATGRIRRMDGSHHSKAGQILASLDNLLGEVVGGPAAVNAGCRQCHEQGRDWQGWQTQPRETWPNTGIGRINPDGSPVPAPPVTVVTASPGPGTHARHLRQMPCGSRPSADRGLQRIQTRHHLPRQRGRYESRIRQVGRRRRYSAAPTCATCP